MYICSVRYSTGKSKQSISGFLQGPKSRPLLRQCLRRDRNWRVLKSATYPYSSLTQYVHCFLRAHPDHVSGPQDDDWCIPNYMYLLGFLHLSRVHVSCIMYLTLLYRHFFNDKSLLGCFFYICHHTTNYLSDTGYSHAAKNVTVESVIQGSV